MSDSDEIEVTAKSDSLTIKAKGGVANRLGNQVADVISPFSGMLGAIGDHVDQYRMLRRESAAAALIRAKELKLLAGEQPHPISQKVLAPWLEGAATEDLRTENLLELWARILAKSPEEFDTAFLKYVDITKNIGPREAEFFQMFMGHYVSTQIPEGFFTDLGLGTKSHNIAAAENGNWLHAFEREIIDENGDFLPGADIRKKIEETNSILVGQIIHFLVFADRNHIPFDGKKLSESHVEWIEWNHSKSSEIEALRLIGLVRINSAKKWIRSQSEGHSCVLDVVEPTALGCSFYFSVIVSEEDRRHKLVLASELK